MSHQLTITASEFAALAGMHPYVNREEAWKKALLKSANKAFLNALTSSADTTVRRLRLPEISEEIRQLPEVAQFITADAVTPEIQQSCNDAIEKAGATIISRTVDACAAASGDPSYPREAAREELTRMVKNTPNTERGKKREPRTMKVLSDEIDAVSKAFADLGLANPPKLDYTAERMDLHSIELVIGQNDAVSDNGGDYKLLGVADGIETGPDGSKIVVEVKTRMSRFMKPDYDLIQLACYLQLYSADRGILVQELNGKTSKSDPFSKADLQSLWCGAKRSIDITVEAMLKGQTDKALASDIIKHFFGGEPPQPSLQRGPWKKR